MSTEDAEWQQPEVDARVEVHWHKLLPRARTARISMFTGAQRGPAVGLKSGQVSLTCFIFPSAPKKLC